MCHRIFGHLLQSLTPDNVQVTQGGIHLLLLVPLAETTQNLQRAVQVHRLWQVQSTHVEKAVPNLYAI